VVPEIRPVAAFEEILGDDRATLRIACVEPAVANVASTVVLPRADSALLLVGPEGGWSLQEVGRLRQRGTAFLGLGPRTLRAEAAPTVALAVLWTQWGWE
jgi:16S rRNA (uracil1498-N3)-methyltransferase